MAAASVEPAIPPPPITSLKAGGWFTSTGGGQSLTVVVEQLRSECAIALKACDYTLLKRLATQLEAMAFEQQKAEASAASAAAVTTTMAPARAARASPRRGPAGGATGVTSPTATLVDALVKKPVEITIQGKQACESLTTKALREGRRPHHMVCKDCGLKGPSYGDPAAPGRAWKNRWCAGCAKANHPGAVRNPNKADKCIDCHAVLASCGPPSAADPEVTHIRCFFPDFALSSQFEPQS